MSTITLAMLEVLVLGLLSGIVGTLAVWRKRAFTTVALSHATFPGGVLAAMAGVSVLIGSAVFAVLLVAIMVGLGRIKQQGQQVAAGIVLTFGFALGALLQSMNRDLSIPVDALLIGSLLSVSSTDVLAATGVFVAAVVLFAVSGRELLFSTFDPDGFRSSGFRPGLTDLSVLALIAATVVVTMPAVGAILGVAMIIGPAVTARVLVRNIFWMIPVAALIGVTAGVMGLLASSVFSVAAGGAVGLSVAVLFFCALIVRALPRVRDRNKASHGSNQAQHVAA
jgi:ABC-type Mn2+/Zn2+ transport system permease subunit